MPFRPGRMGLFMKIVACILTGRLVTRNETRDSSVAPERSIRAVLRDSVFWNSLPAESREIASDHSRSVDCTAWRSALSLEIQ